MKTFGLIGMLVVSFSLVGCGGNEGGTIATQEEIQQYQPDPAQAAADQAAAAEAARKAAEAAQGN